MHIDKETSELICKGSNVMTRYAQKYLSKGDEFHSLLHMGDIATIDGDGYFNVN